MAGRPDSGIEGHGQWGLHRSRPNADSDRIPADRDADESYNRGAGVLMAIETKDRLEKLLESSVLNGIDFVEIADATQRVLKVHFLNGVLLQGNITAASITGGETIPSVEVEPIANTDWSFDPDGRPLLTLRTKAV